MPRAVRYVPGINTAKHPSELPDASTPRGALPAEQLVPLAASAVAVPALPVMLAFIEVVETAYVAPLLPAIRPENVERTGALVNVCVPAQVLEVVVPKARAIVLVERVSG